MALYFDQGGTEKYALQDFEPSFGEKFEAATRGQRLEEYTETLSEVARVAAQRNEPKLSAADAAEYLKTFDFKMTLVPKDNEYSKSQLDLIAKRQRELTIINDVRDRTPWDLGSVPRGLAMFGVSMTDPINIATAFMPWSKAIPLASRLNAMRVSSSALTRAGGRVGLGAVDAGISTAVIEPLYYAGRQYIGDDYDAYDSMQNIAFGALVGGGIVGIGGAGADVFRKTLGRAAPSDRFRGMSTDEIMEVQAIEAELKSGRKQFDTVEEYTQSDLAATLDQRIAQAPASVRRALGLDELDVMSTAERRAIEADAAGERPKATQVSIAELDGMITATNLKGYVRGQIDNAVLQITDAFVPEGARGQGNASAMTEALVNRAIDRGLTVETASSVTNDFVNVIQSLERKGLFVETNDTARQVEGGVATTDGRSVFRISMGENYVRPADTAADQVNRADPETREMVFRSGVAQMVDGKIVNIDPIMRTDPNVDGTVTAADIVRVARDSDSPENIGAADFEASEKIADENATSQKWDTVSDAEQALSEADQILDTAIKNGDDAFKYARAQAGADQPGVGVEPTNKLGFEPALRVKAKIGNMKLPDKPLILTGTNNKNAAAQIDQIDAILKKFPKAGESIEEWSKMMAYAFASQEVPIPPYAFLRDINTDNAVVKLRKLTAGQIADADHGFENAAAFRKAYIGKELDSVTTGKLFMWSFLSRGVSPYTQEALFIDAFPGVDKWIKKAADGQFTEADFSEYEKWAKSVAPAGSGQPGAGATHNLNAFGKSFLFKMGAKDENGVSYLQRLHNMMEDPNATGQQIRREFIKFSEGVGINNKVVSFTLLVAGFDDVVVLDRVQIRQLWDDGRFGDKNLYDGRKENNKPVAGSSLADLTMGARGLLIYEAIERTLKTKVDEIYKALGRADNASIGRFHWETWVADSQQEASHGTLGAILPDAKGDDMAIARVTAKQGEYGAYEYGAMYGRGTDGTSYFVYNTPNGSNFEFTVPAFREFLTEIKRPAAGVVPTKFKVTESGNAPWFTRPEVDQEKLREVAAKWADRKGGTGEGAQLVQAALDGQDLPLNGGSRYARGSESSLNRLDSISDEQLDELLQENGFVIKSKDEAESLWSSGHAIYAFHEMDERPFRVKDRTLFDRYQPDQLIGVTPEDVAAFEIDPQFSRGLSVGTAENLQQTIAQSFGKDTQKLLDAGQIRIVNKPNDIPGGPHPEDVKAATASDGTVYMVAENLTVGEIKGITLHEIGVHVGMRQMLGDVTFNDVLKQVDAAILRGETWAQAARDAVPPETRLADIPEEQLAYLVQNSPELPLVQRIIAAVRAWFYKNFESARQFITLTEADFRQLAVSSLQFAARQAEAEEVGGFVYSRGNTQDTSTIKNELKAEDDNLARVRSYADVLRAAADKLDNDATAVAAMKSAMPDITAQEIDELLQGLRRQVTNMRMMTRAARDAMLAGQKADEMQSDAMIAANKMSADMEQAAIISRRNAALNVAVRLKLSTFANQFKESGLDAEGFFAILGGSQRVRVGARLSVDAEAKAFRSEYVGGMLADLEKANVKEVFISGAFDREIYDALYKLGQKNPDMSTISKEVLTVANIVNKYQENARNRRNRFGAWIRDLQGYITRQSHDMYKIREVTEDEWVNFIKDKLDVPKMIRLGLISETDPIGSLRGLYGDFSSGLHLKGKAGEEDIVAFSTGTNLAKRESVSRSLYFKDGISAYEYNERFGVGRLADSVLHGLEKSAQSAALLKLLGTNPEANLTQVMDEYEASLVGERRTKFHQKRGAILNMLKQVDGSVNIPGDVTAAKIGSFLRVWQTMAKLGGSMISSFSDLAGFAAELRYSQDKNLLSGVGTAIGSLLTGRAKGEQADILVSLGVFHESMAGAITQRFDTPELTGKTAYVMRQYFRLNGLTWWTEALRDGAALSHSSFLATQRNKSFADLSPDVSRTLAQYNIDAGKWDLMRQGMMRNADGVDYMTPDAVRTIPRESLEAYITSVGRTPNETTVNNLIDDLAQTMRTMFLDRAHFAVIEPGARARAFMYRGTQPGTVPGELLRYITQFKSFSVAMTQMVLGREVYGRGYDTLGDYLRNGKGDMLGLAAMVGLYTVLGYASMTVKDLLKGREPRNPLDYKTWMAALAQSGGLGIYGDFLFGEVARNSGSLVSTIAGPVAGLGDTLMNLFQRMRDGDDVAAASFRAFLNNTPFLNIFYLRPLLDYLILFNIQESLNPGFLRRMEQRIERENNQTFFIKPSEVVR